MSVTKTTKPLSIDSHLWEIMEHFDQGTLVHPKT